LPIHSPWGNWATRASMPNNHISDNAKYTNKIKIFQVSKRVN